MRQLRTAPLIHPLPPCICRNKVLQITYALANVYEDTPDVDTLVTASHRSMAQEFMGVVEAGDAEGLRCAGAAAADVSFNNCAGREGVDA